MFSLNPADLRPEAVNLGFKSLKSHLGPSHLATLIVPPILARDTTRVTALPLGKGLNVPTRRGICMVLIT